VTSTHRRHGSEQPVIKPGSFGLPTTNLPGWKPYGQYSSTRRDGNFFVGSDPTTLAANRARIIDLPWAWLHQVHGDRVVTVSHANIDEVRGAAADALVTADVALVLAVQTADCAPVTLASREGVVAVAHAGWRGLNAGILEATVARMRELGATEIHAEVGPCIHVECYEFSPEDLSRLSERFGEHVAGTTSWGAPALDVIQAVHASLHEGGVTGRGHGPGECTACCREGERSEGHTDGGPGGTPRYFSHRARGETQRMATVIWREESPTT
jgi:YfiH family protein